MKHYSFTPSSQKHPVPILLVTPDVSGRDADVNALWVGILHSQEAFLRGKNLGGMGSGFGPSDNKIKNNLPCLAFASC